MSESVILIKNLNKTYKNGFQALKDVSLDIHKGEIFGLLGPNGAGKTTLINIVAGLVFKTSGEVTVMGKDVEKEYRFTRSKIGLVQQELAADPFLKVEEYLRLQAGYFGIRSADARIEQLLKDLKLDDKRKSPGRSLSGGMKRRMMIAKALVHDPEIVFLDEPTAGVDVELRENLWSLVRTMRKMHKTIILTTHYLEEAEALADRVAIINQGRILLVEEKEKLLSDHGTPLADIYRKYVNQDNNV
ncbi:MAG: ABC transporter ATP-binding protein [Candidatus Komeilibacteria bacterium]|nr:ABC transporter ATP-binding protein [Candidatus Komeilibacteria bacterium]